DAYIGLEDRPSPAAPSGAECTADFRATPQRRGFPRLVPLPRRRATGPGASPPERRGFFVNGAGLRPSRFWSDDEFLKRRLRSGSCRQAAKPDASVAAGAAGAAAASAACGGARRCDLVSRLGP